MIPFLNGSLEKSVQESVFPCHQPQSLRLAPELLGKTQPLPLERSPFQGSISLTCTLCTQERRGLASALKYGAQMWTGNTVQEALGYFRIADHLELVLKRDFHSSSIRT